jgi:hypothetical protein
MPTQAFPYLAFMNPQIDTNLHNSIHIRLGSALLIGSALEGLHEYKQPWHPMLGSFERARTAACCISQVVRYTSSALHLQRYYDVSGVHEVAFSGNGYW